MTSPIESREWDVSWQSFTVEGTLRPVYLLCLSWVREDLEIYLAFFCLSWVGQTTSGPSTDQGEPALQSTGEGGMVCPQVQGAPWSVPLWI